MNQLFNKDTLIIISYVASIIAALYGFLRWFWPRVSPYMQNQFYYHSTGIHIIQDIEKHFGKEAGRVLRDIVQQRGLEIVIDEMRLNIIENAIGLGIYICDADGKCTYANKTLAKMFGISQHEMLGFGWLSSVVDKQKAYNNWKFAVDHVVPYRDTYDVVVDGRAITYRTEAEASMDETNQTILGYVGIIKKVE